jgi:hypothetical protein
MTHPVEGKRLADLLSHADSIIGHGDNTAYISRASSKYVRDVVRELAAALRSQGGKAEPVAWRYKCEHDGKYVFMETRLTDEQKARGYFLDDIELEENPEEEGPFKWSEEAPLYASPPPSPASVEAHSPAENVSWTAEMQRAAEKAAFYSPRNFEGIYRAICAALPREEQA